MYSSDTGCATLASSCTWFGCKLRPDTQTEDWTEGRTDRPIDRQAQTTYFSPRAFISDRFHSLFTQSVDIRTVEPVIVNQMLFVVSFKAIPSCT